jgi:metal-dependent amidase/aminoacylase/carboxypeptidase family protein
MRIPRCTALLLLLVLAVVPVIGQKKKAAAPAAPDPSAGLEQKIAAGAAAIKDKVIAQRRDFHMHPELSNREERTGRVIAERLKEIGFTDIRINVARHGVVAVLTGGKPGPVVAVRADIDALPINETMDVPYKSQNPGVKHACGHDAHAAVELGVAEVLFGLRDQIPGTIKFIFQPAEEGAPTGEEGGAKLMVKEGALQNPAPQAIFGLHTNPSAKDVHMEGTLRTLNQEVRARVKALMKEEIEGIAKAAGANATVVFNDGNFVLYNDPKLVEQTLPAMKRVLGEANVIKGEPMMPSEDFPEYTQQIPGFFYNLGTGNKARGITAGWHTPEYDVDENSLEVGVRLMSSVLLDYLQRNSRSVVPK